MMSNLARSLRHPLSLPLSTLQAASSAGVTTHPVKEGPRDTAASVAGMRRRRLGGGSGGGSLASFGRGSGGSNMLRFYTDDAPGLKIVLVMNLCFIGFVTSLHVFGKLYCYRSGAA